MEHQVDSLMFATSGSVCLRRECDFREVLWIRENVSMYREAVFVSAGGPGGGGASALCCYLVPGCVGDGSGDAGVGFSYGRDTGLCDRHASHSG